MHRATQAVALLPGLSTKGPGETEADQAQKARIEQDKGK